MITAAGNVSTANLDSIGSSKGGDISLASASGAITTGFIVSSSTKGAGGTGGSITVRAANNVSTAALDSSGDSRGGDISVTSANGAIAFNFTSDAFLNAINSSSANGAGGNVTVEAATNLTVGGVDASGKPSGNITLQGNEIDLTGGAGSVQAPGGNLILQPAAPGQNILLGGPSDSNPKTLDLTTSDLAALGILKTPDGGPAGFSSVTLRSNGTGMITVPAGTNFDTPITFQSPDGAIVLGPTIQAPALTASGATISLQGVTTTGNQSYTGEVTLNSPTVPAAAILLWRAVPHWEATPL